MPNFKKVSRFDDGAKPPETEYIDYKKEDTYVIKVDFEGSYESILNLYKSKFKVVEEIYPGLQAERAGRTWFRVLKKVSNGC